MIHLPTIRVAALLAVVTATTAAHGQSVLLKQRFPVGQTLYIEHHFDAAMSVTGEIPQLPSGDLNVKTQICIGQRQLVEDRARDRTRLRLTIERVLIKIELPGIRPIGFDTDNRDPKDGSAQLGDAVTPLIGKSYLIEFDNDGKVRSTQGLNEIQALFNTRAAAGLPPMKVLETFFESDRVADQITKPRKIFYTGEHVEAGTTWKSSDATEFGDAGELVISYDCKITNVMDRDGRRIAKLAFTGDARLADEARAREFINLPFKLASAKVRGGGEFDPRRGRYAQLTTDADLTFRAKGRGYDGEEVPVVARFQVVQVSRAITPGERAIEKQAGDKKEG